MKSRVTIACLVAAVGAAAPAIAQDSVGNTGGLPGDAVYPWDTTEQSNAYVVDLAPFASSWGNEFGIAPVTKNSQAANPDFFTHLSSGHGLSQDARDVDGFPAESYDVWNGPGFGVNGNVNLDPDMSIPGSSLSGVQLGFIGQEFDTAPGGIPSNIIFGGFINYEPSNPARLYVVRTAAAHSGQDPVTGAGDNSTFGAGSADAHGNLAFRADAFGSVGSDPLTGDNWYRINAELRDTSMVNEIRNSGPQDAAASDWFIVNSGTVHTTPGVIPESISGRAIVAGLNFDSQYVNESAFLTPSTTMAHLAGTSGDRGALAFSPKTIFADSIGTCSALGLAEPFTHDDDANSMLIWGVDSDGNYVDGRRIVLPMSITDNDDGFTVTDGPALADQFYFGNFQSQVPFRGSNGAVAIGMDQRGNLLAAAQLFLGDLAFFNAANGQLADDTPTNAIAVARFPNGDIDAAPEWTLAAWTDTLPGNGGKEIKDGPGGAAIGRLTDLAFITGGSPLGPSISSPMMDSAGNIYFVGAIENFNNPDDQFDTGLIRAVYRQDAEGPAYELELLFELGFIFDGQNSGVPYQVQFLDLVDSNSIGSAAPFSQCITPGPVGNADNSSLEPQDPRNLGGLIVAADITYDVDGDGDFEDPTGANPDSDDESYNVYLWVGATAPIEAEECFADCNGDQVLNILDFVCYQGVFSSGSLDADCNGDNVLNILDFVCFQGEFAAGCNF